MKFRRIALWAFIDVLGTSLGVALLSVHPPAIPASAPMQALEIITADWATADGDNDVDLWVVPPNRKPVFFGNRQGGCVTLDQDNKGWVDSVIHNPDGSTTEIPRAKETVALRCLTPGHYDIGVNLFAHRQHDLREDQSHLRVPVHIEVVDLNPTTRTVFSKDVVLLIETQTINVASFDMAPDGKMTFVDPPLEPVTAARLE